MEIITAYFAQQSKAAAAFDELRNAGFAVQGDAVIPDPDFRVSPDPAVSPGAEDAAPSAAKTAVVGSVVGVVAAAVAVPLLGPGAILVGAGLGAYTGSLVGALNGLDEAPAGDEAPTSAPDEPMLNILVNGAAGKTEALAILSAHDARVEVHAAGSP